MAPPPASMMTPLDTPDLRRLEARLEAALPVIYGRHPDAEGLPAARRIAAITAGLMADAGPAGNVADLVDASPDDAGLVVPGLDNAGLDDAAALNAAALFHLAGPPGDGNRPAASAAIARAWLTGAGAPDAFIAAVSGIITGAAATGNDNNGAGAGDSVGVGVGVGDETGDDAGSDLLRQAALLDLTSVERHRDWLRAAPATYLRHCLLPALTLRGRLTGPAAPAAYDAMLPRLAAWLDAQCADNPTGVIPADWRRLVEVPDIERGVAQLLAGEDPVRVRAAMPAAGRPYAEYRGMQRAVIAGSHDRILELAHARIEASRNVAAEKYLESDTIHKPAVEENLFVGARRQARRLGLSPETAEDIARLLLSNARAVQEHTLNDIAQRVSRLHGQVLDADSPESGAGEADIAIPSLVARTGDQPLARENELIKELRVTGLNESYPGQRRQFARWFASPHPYMETGQLVGSRDAAPFLQALAAGQPVKVIATMSAEGAMHLGHGALAQLLVYFQTLGAQIVIGFRGGGTKSREGGDRPAASGARSTAARREMAERLLTLAAAGLELAQTDAYLQTDRAAIMETALALGDAIPLSVLNSALGLRLRDSVTDTFRPLLRLADILHTQQPAYGGPGPTLVIDGIGGDVYVRMARNVAERFGFVKPSALYLRMVRSLTTYQDPRTGSAVEVMTNAVPQGRIACDDDEDRARARIARAYTGGRGTLAEQRERGGNPDPRICAVSGLHAFFATPEPAAYAELQRRCRAGALLCGECKGAAADGVTAYLRQRRQQRDSLPAAAKRRARAMAGLAARAQSD